MPDNWSFVAAAYGVAAVVLGGYWRFLRRKERMLSEGTATAPSRGGVAARAEKAANP